MTIESVDPFAGAVPAGDPSAPKPMLSDDEPQARVLPEEEHLEESQEPEKDAPEVEEEAPGDEEPEQPEQPEAKPSTDDKTADEISKVRKELEETRAFARKQQAEKDKIEAALKAITPTQEKSYRDELEAQYPIINDENAFDNRVSEVGHFKATREREAAIAAVNTRLSEAKNLVRERALIEARASSAAENAIEYGKAAGMTEEQLGKLFRSYGHWASMSPEDALQAARDAIDLHAPSLARQETAEQLARITEKKIRKNLARALPKGGLGAGADAEDSDDWRAQHLAGLEKSFAVDVSDPFA